MASIAVPPEMRERIARENLVKGLLDAIHKAGDEGFTLSRLRAGFARLGVSPVVAQYVENRLVREGIVKLDGDRMRIGALADIRAFLARSKWDESRVVAVAPEEPAA
jgi:hypothetical protein